MPRGRAAGRRGVRDDAAEAERLDERAFAARVEEVCADYGDRFGAGDCFP